MAKKKLNRKRPALSRVVEALVSLTLRINHVCSMVESLRRDMSMAGIVGTRPGRRPLSAGVIARYSNSPKKKKS